MVQAHNAGAAQVWGHGGAAYDVISFGLSDAISHAVQALWPRPGERILDIGTGTGWTARLTAGQGAEVTAVDVAEGMLEGARALSAHLPIDFRLADAEALPFPDGHFDGVISTYGVMFAGNPAAAAAEMARVTRPGGRLVLLTWHPAPEGYIPAFFRLVASYADAPPPASSPMLWGDPDFLARTLTGFEITAEVHPTTLFAPDPATVWEEYARGFGPVRRTAEALPPDRAAAFRTDFEAMHRRYATPQGLRIEREAVLVRGRRIG